MKTIKLFEEFSNKLFTEISLEEWRDKLCIGNNFEANTENYTHIEYNWIKEYFKGWLIFDAYGDSNINSNFPFIVNRIEHTGPASIINLKAKKIGSVNRRPINLGAGDDGFTISKMTDDWYYVCDKYSRTYYRCDTFDGLKQCLEYCLNV